MFRIETEVFGCKWNHPPFEVLEVPWTGKFELNNVNLCVTVS